MVSDTPTLIERVRRCLAAYCHAADDRDLDALAQVFAPDVVLQVGDREFNGRERVVQVIGRSLGHEPVGKHVCVNVAVTLEDGGVRPSARATSDFVVLDEQARPTTMGRYRDIIVFGANDHACLARRSIDIQFPAP